MSKSTWFETVAEAQRRAKKRLPPSVYGALLAGSESGSSYADNTASFAQLGFAPLRLGDGLEPGALAHEVPLLKGNPRNAGTSARGLRARAAPAHSPAP